MRLLKREGEDTFSLTKDFLGDDEIPPYAILSHTWGEGEILFQDLNGEAYKSKKGYRKMQFCAAQAAKDRLKYFWNDTCCINKTDQTELQDAINSMYRWYQGAAKCYVYLTDVSAPADGSQADIEPNKPSWLSAFQKSRWFTRGWTLQELLAPINVEFFSVEGVLLGDKNSLAKLISNVTGIPIPAIPGNTLNQFSTNERFSWAKNRNTTRKEDKAYCLLGIFGVFMSLNYGEGEDNAFKRLRRKIEKSQQKHQAEWSQEQKDIIKRLRVTDPRHDKKRIEDTKGGLLRDSYRWVLENPDFLEWYAGQDSRVLWIRGDAGKGKTMLLCGIINEMEELKKEKTLIAYFFCQSTDSRINNATAILRGLLYMFVTQRPASVSHIQRASSDSADTIFDDVNAWVALCEMLENILEDLSEPLVFVIDALDECTTDLPKLLDLIMKISAAPYPVKWIVSSRNLPDIEGHLAITENRRTLSLELNAQSISKAVSFYIQHKVANLARLRRYDEKIRVDVLEHFIKNAQDTFLWVALTCQSLEGVPKRKVMEKLTTFPPGLNALYTRMIEQIGSSDDAILSKRILACVTTVYQPITVAQLTLLVHDVRELEGDFESVRDIIYSCGSFLTLKNDTIYFVHQSAKDFLCTDGCQEIFPRGMKMEHKALLSASLSALLSDALHRDLYDLRDVSIPIEQVNPPDPDPLAVLKYPCLYWVDHLGDSASENTEDVSLDIDRFLRNKYLYWLEALSLLRRIPEGNISMAKLESLIDDQSSLNIIVYDAYRFIMYHETPIAKYPLQTYTSALLFSPSESIIKKSFSHESPSWIAIKSTVPQQWSPSVRTFEGHKSPVTSLAFSYDSKLLASLSLTELKVWEVMSGRCVQTFSNIAYDANFPEGGLIEAIAFSGDSEHIVVMWPQGSVSLINVDNGKYMNTIELPDLLETHDVSSTRTMDLPDVLDVSSPGRLSMWSSANSTKFVLNWRYNFYIWDVSNNTCTRLLYSTKILSVILPCDSTLLSSVSTSGSIQTWDTIKGERLSQLTLGVDIKFARFNDDGSRLCTVTERTIKSLRYPYRITLWDRQSGDRLWTQTLFGNRLSQFHISNDLSLITFLTFDVATTQQMLGLLQKNSDGRSRYVRRSSDLYSCGPISDDNKYLASPSAPLDQTITLLSPSQIQNHEVDDRLTNFHAVINGWLEVSYESCRVAWTLNETLSIWNVRESKHIFVKHFNFRYVQRVTFSADLTRIAGVKDNVVTVWDINTAQFHRFPGIRVPKTRGYSFSRDAQLFASISKNLECQIWDLNTGKCLTKMNVKKFGVLASRYHAHLSLVFSHDSKQIACVSDNYSVEIFDTKSGELLKEFQNKASRGDLRIDSVALSSTRKRLAVVDSRFTRVFDSTTGDCLHIYSSNGHSRLFFDATEWLLHTNFGAIEMEPASTAHTSQHEPNPSFPQYKGLTVGRDSIIYNSKVLVWIPVEYRFDLDNFSSRKRVQVMEKTVIIVDGQKRAWIYEFDLDRLPIVR